MCALDTGVLCQETLRLVQFLLLKCTNKEAAGMPISYVLCSKQGPGTQHCSPEAKQRKQLGAKHGCQILRTKLLRKSLGRILVKKSENIITYSTPAVSHALAVFNIFMAFVFDHSCQCLPYSYYPCSTPEGQRGVTSHFSEEEQRPGVLLTCQLSNTAFHKQSAKVSRHKSNTGSSCMMSEQGPLACTRSHILPSLPVATSGVNTVQRDLLWSQRTSVIEKKPKQIIEFGLQELNHLYLSYHSTLPMASTSMSGNFANSLVDLPLTSPPVLALVILQKDKRVAIPQSSFLAYSCIYQRVPVVTPLCKALTHEEKRLPLY